MGPQNINIVSISACVLIQFTNNIQEDIITWSCMCTGSFYFVQNSDLGNGSDEHVTGDNTLAGDTVTADDGTTPEYDYSSQEYIEEM